MIAPTRFAPTAVSPTVQGVLPPTVHRVTALPHTASWIIILLALAATIAKRQTGDVRIVPAGTVPTGCCPMWGGTQSTLNAATLRAWHEARLTFEALTFGTLAHCPFLKQLFTECN